MFSHSDYLACWVCALPLEMAAATAMLDETHPALPQPRSDPNNYTLGSISGHNVVIVCLPSGVYGSTSATAVVTQMKLTFSAIQFGLLVGIGGGAPTASTDIRLGDVVVSRPTGTSPGVLQYDYGKTVQGGFERVGSLNKPPQVLLTAMSQIISNHEMGRKRQLEIMAGARSKFPDMDSYFCAPPKKTDQLFQPLYEHAWEEATCHRCSADYLIPRPPRSRIEPLVFYGIVASANQVMRHGATRDRLANELGILCFEMEAAGVMDLFPCVVIRGICDYSDSHKHKLWQRYAAGTAAAYAKELLSVIPVSSHGQLDSDNEYMIRLEKECLQDLFLTDPRDDKNALKRKKGDRAPGTCTWILDSSEIQRWIHGGDDGHEPSNILWLYGNPGTGKSTTAIMMTEELPGHADFNEKRLAYFFCDSSSKDRGTVTAILRGLIYQFIEQDGPLIRSLLPKYQDQRRRAFSSFDALWSVLTAIGANAETGKKYCIVDALDECDRDSQEQLLRQINMDFGSRASSNTQSRLHFLITSRPYPEIFRELHAFHCKDLATFSKVQHDLHIMIKEKVNYLQKRNRYTDAVAKEVSDILQDKAEGTFLWVGIACEELEGVRSRDAAKTIEKLPRGLNALYNQLLQDALEEDEHNDPVVLRILSVVSVAYRPLSVQELAEACQLYATRDEQDRLAFIQEDIEQCRLMVIIRDSVVQLLHKSVKDFVLGDDDSYPINLLKAHAELANRCIEYILISMQSTRNPPRVFIHYANVNWKQHASSARHEFSILAGHARLFRLSLHERKKWEDMFWQELSFPPTMLSAFHFAATWGIPALIRFALNEQSPKPYDDLELESVSGRTPLQECAQHGHLVTMALLLECGKSNMTIRTQVLEAAARNTEVGVDLMSLLLNQPMDQTPVTATVLGFAASNPRFAKEIIDLIFSRRQVQACLTDSAIRTINASLKEAEINAAIKLLLNQRYNDPISATAVTLICERGEDSLTRQLLMKDQMDIELSLEGIGVIFEKFDVDMIQILLSRHGSRVHITKDIVKSVLFNHNHAIQILPLIINHELKNFPDINDIVEDIVSDPRASSEPLLALLSYRQFQATTALATVACSHRDSRTVAYFLDTQNPPFHVDQRMIEAAAQNWSYGTEVMSLLIRRVTKRIEVTASMIISIEGSPWKGEETLALLLAQPIHRVQLTTQVIHMITERCSMKIVGLLLDRYGTEVDIVESIIIHVFLYRDGPETVKLLGRYHGGVQIPSDAFQVAFQSWENAEDITELLSLYPSHQVQITETFIHSMAASWSARRQVLVFLFSRTADRMKISPAAVNLICRNFDSETVRLMLRNLGHCTEITPDVMAEAFRKFDMPLVTSILMRHHGLIELTKEISHAIVSNTKCSREIMALLMRRESPKIWILPDAVPVICQSFDPGIVGMVKDKWPDSLPITREIVVSAAENPGNGYLVMETLMNQGEELKMTTNAKVVCCQLFDAALVKLMLTRPGSTFEITNDMMISAARNWKHGDNVMELLLNWGSKSLLITDVVLEAAVRNWVKGKAITTLLLKQPRENLQVTERVLKAAACSWSNGSEIIPKLLDQWGDQVSVTENVTVAAAGNRKEVMMLLPRCGDTNVQITERVIRATAGNQHSGKDIMELLFHDYAHQMHITEAVLEAAAGNQGGGAQIITFLLERGIRLEITRKVVVAAGNNQLCGQDVAKLFLNQDGDQVNIWRDALIAMREVPRWWALRSTVDKLIALRPPGMPLEKMRIGHRGCPNSHDRHDLQLDHRIAWRNQRFFGYRPLNILKSATANAFADGKTSTEYLKQQFSALLHRHSIPAPETYLESLASIYKDALRSELSLKLDVPRLLQKLKRAGKQILVVAEGPRDTQEWTIGKLGLTDDVNYLITSNEVRKTKTKVRVNLTAATGIFIGDNEERDVLPAQAEGIFAIHYDESRDHSYCMKRYQGSVRSMTEIIEILDLPVHDLGQSDVQPATSH